MSNLSHTPSHIDCPACEDARIQVIAEALGERLTPSQLSEVQALAALTGIRPTEVITRALKTYRRKLEK